MNIERLPDFLQTPRIGFFTMEIALRSDIPTYSGGLGVLAGDALRSAADLRIPLVAVSLVSRQGYFRQEIDAEGRQIEGPDPWNPGDWTEPLPAKVAVKIGGRRVWIGSWLYVVDGLAEGCQPVILLDTNLAENSEDDRRITDVLYGGDQAYRLSQEIVLGVGGVKMLDALGFKVEQYHLNEGHSALLTLQLLRNCAYETNDVRVGDTRYDIPRVRERCHFTTHTPVEAGHDRFAYGLADELLGDFIDADVLRRLAGADELNTTRLALNLSEYVNGVAKRHAETSNKLFPGYHMSAITNGVHAATWAHPEIAALYDARLPGWRSEPELLMRADYLISADELWSCHMKAKHDLLARIRTECGASLDADRPIIGYGRRMTQYKRPELLFADIERLKSINAAQPFQIVLAGKAHPHDEPGKRAIEHLHAISRDLSTELPVVFLPNYSMDTALAMVSGSDLWLNTPRPPMEASGTSGMKAAINGLPNLSVLDGWWVEGHIEGITGWSIGDGGATDSSADAKILLDKLEHIVLPLYADRESWIRIMKGAIARNGSMFHSHRMMRRYAAEAYLR